MRFSTSAIVIVLASVSSSLADEPMSLRGNRALSVDSTVEEQIEELQEELVEIKQKELEEEKARVQAILEIEMNQYAADVENERSIEGEDDDYYYGDSEDSSYHRLAQNYDMSVGMVSGYGGAMIGGYEMWAAAEENEYNELAEARARLDIEVSEENEDNMNEEEGEVVV